jgi:unsaturated rhamnogalacturonyl hydrolase
VVGKVIQAMLCMQRDAWEQGVAAQALLEWGDVEKALLLARDAVVRQDSSGRLAIVQSTAAVTDPAAGGEAVLMAARLTEDAFYKEAADRMIEYLLVKAPKTEDGILYHNNNQPWLWIDSMYMAPPFLAVAGQPQEAVKQVEGFRKHLWNPDMHLYSHIWDVGEQKFIRRDFWGVGNGWAAAGMSRVIAALPGRMHTDRQRLIGYVQELLQGCLEYQRSDGLFYDVIDNPKTFIETNLGQMLAYTIYSGVHAGWLENGLLVAADRMRMAAYAKVDNHGLVQGVCGSPFFDRSGTATEGQSFFILMEAAARVLGKGEL